MRPSATVGSADRVAGDRRITAARVARDLLYVLVGVFLLVAGLAVRVPLSGDYAWISGLLLIVAFAVAAVVHLAIPLRRTWKRRTRLGLCLGGLVLGGFLVVFAVAALGIGGTRASAPLTACEYRPAPRHHAARGGAPAHYLCTASVRWPDGSTSVLVASAPRDAVGVTVPFVRPVPALTGLVAPGAALAWPVPASMGLVGLGLLGQAVFSLAVLAVTGRRPTGPRAG